MPVHGQIVGYCSYTAVNKVDSLFPNKVGLVVEYSFTTPVIVTHTLECWHEKFIQQNSNKHNCLGNIVR